MSDSLVLNDSKRGRGSNTVFVVIIVLLLVNVGATVFLFAYTNRYVSNLSDLTVRNSLLQNQISSLNQEIESLKSQLAVQKYLNASESMLLPQIYNQTMFSVVLITVKTPQGSAQGSGFVYDQKGHILTNNHVVDKATAIEVTFIDGTIASAALVGTDPYSDLAVVRVSVDFSLLYPLSLGSSSDLVVGETVIAIGNPYGLSNSMTVGIVCQLGRELSASGGYLIVDVIQTDAAINKGNSGGPMLNLRGEVVGMNTAILTMTGEWQGIGFAIPSDTIKREVLSLITRGSYDHAYLGITGAEMKPDIAEAMGLPNNTRGALVVEVVRGGPSDGKLIGGNREITIDRSKIKVGGDVLIGADGYVMKSFYDIILYLERNKRPGDSVNFNVIRGKQLITVTIKLGTRPPPSS